MASHDPDHLSEAEAARLWARAAELQAEAARRADGRDEEVAADRRIGADGYALEHVRAAAIEAGIGGEFIDAALSEVNSERALPKPSGGLVDRAARAFLGAPGDFIEVRRVIEASATTVLVAMERVCPGEPYRLILKDRMGVPHEGGVMVFDIAGAGFGASEGWVRQASWADMREVYASIRPIPGDPPRCELTVRSPVSWARALNFGIGGTVTIGGGAAGFGLGLGAFAALQAVVALGALAPLVSVAILTLGVASGSGIVLNLFRWMYDKAIEKGQGALRSLVGAIAAEAQGGWGIGALRVSGASSADLGGREITE